MSHTTEIKKNKTKNKKPKIWKETCEEGFQQERVGDKKRGIMVKTENTL